MPPDGAAYHGLMDERGDGTSRRPSWNGLWLLLALMLPCTLYGSTYVFARATHRLVNYGGGHIMRANAMSGWGFGFSWWEVAFLPATFAEEIVRSNLGPY